MIAETEFKDPSVVLIGSLNCKRDAWVLSRPHLDHSNLDIKEIEKMDIPVNGMSHYVFHINSSLLFRDLMLTLRPIVPWARSNRTTPMSNKNMFLSGEYKGLKDYALQVMMNSMYEDIKSGIPQDFAKKKLPMAANTEFTISVDDRTLVSFLKVLYLHNKDLYEAYGKLFLKAMEKEEDYLLSRHTVDIFDKLALSEAEVKAIGTTNEYLESFTGVYELSLNLASQFIRQHFAKIKNGLYNMIDQKPLLQLVYIRCFDTIPVALYTDRATFRRTLSVRSCFFGQWDHAGSDSWSNILDPYVKHQTNEEFLKLLPCEGVCTQCKIFEDMKPRLQAGRVQKIIRGGKEVTITGEVNPPCAILIEKPEMIDFRVKKYGSNSVVSQKWVALVEAGLIKDNPENSNRVEYEKNVRLYGLPE
jgi:hypothetical protein